MYEKVFMRPQMGFVTARMNRRNSPVLSAACLLWWLWWETSCVQGRRSVLFARQRSTSEIPG
jgi:hypothetical protein